MRLVKIVKLQRVRYGDLDEGATYRGTKWPAGECIAKGNEPLDSTAREDWDDWEVIAIDSTPEVTYNIEGIPDERIERWVECGYEFFDLITPIPAFDESEIETRYI